MNVTVNGQVFEIPTSVTVVGELLDHLSLNKDFAIVEQNGVILEKKNWNEAIVSDHDRFEIVQFVGGG